MKPYITFDYFLYENETDLFPLFFSLKYKGYTSLYNNPLYKYLTSSFEFSPLSKRESISSVLIDSLKIYFVRSSCFINT